MDFIYLKDGSFIRADTIAAVKVIFDDTYGARVAVHYVVGQTRELSVVTYKFMDAAMLAAREIVEEIEAATKAKSEGAAQYLKPIVDIRMAQPLPTSGEPK